MDREEPTKIIVRWRTRDEDVIAGVRKKFGFPNYTTFNGWTPGQITPEDRVALDSYVRFGFLTYMEKDWTYNGSTYSWKM